MKARTGIIALILSLGIFTLTCKDHDERNVDKRTNHLSFAKYYESCEVKIKPDASGYELPLDVNDIVNVDKINKYVDFNSISDLIEQNGFAVVELDPFSDLSFDDFISFYRTFGDSNTPAFVSSDTGLYLYHILFDDTLKDIEENLFVPDIKDLTGVLINDALSQYEQLEGDLKEAAMRNSAYLSVAQRLIDPNSTIPELVNDIASGELAKIAAHNEFNTSDIFKYKEDYSQYVPRGHYTQSETLKRYFQTMMWFGRMTFLLKGSDNRGPAGEALVSVQDAKIHTLQALLLAWSLKNVNVGERTGLGIWDGMCKVKAFYVGISDDLTPHDYIGAMNEVFGKDCSIGDFDDEGKLNELKKKLALLSSPNIYGGTGNIRLTYGDVTSESLNNVLEKTKGMRFFGQSFVPDSYMFQQLIFPETGSYLGESQDMPFTAVSNGMGGHCRGYVRGLDLMAVLGSDEAMKIMDEAGDTRYERYGLRVEELKDKFDTMTVKDWNYNLYSSWLYSMRGLLQELPDGYPEFVRTQAWQRRKLNTALASWTQLRHDTILEVKQNYAPPPPAARLPDPPPPPPPPPGYVEPIPVFWGRLLSQTRMASKGFDDLNVLRPEARRRFAEFEKLLQEILDIAGRQLKGVPLLPADGEFFKKLPSRLKSVVRDIDHKDSMTTLVADVVTNSAEGKVVEEAIGEFDLIVTACPMREDYVFLAVGPVLSYYEFKHPMSDRLTDESWELMLYSSVKPERPKWYVPMMKLHENFSGLMRLTNNLLHSGYPCWLKDGKIAFVGRDKDWNPNIYVMNADGRELKNLTNKPDLYRLPVWSPDRTKIAFVAGDRPNKCDIYVMNSDGSGLKRLTDNNTDNSSPSWSPDGKKIAFDSGRYLRRKIYIMNADGSEKKILINDSIDNSSPHWSPDGEKIAFVSFKDANFDIYVMRFNETEPKRLTNNPHYDGMPRWSPDGKQIVFVSDRDDNLEIYIMNADGSKQKRLTNNSYRDVSPCWSPDGKRIAFSSSIGRKTEIFILDLESSEK
jgi:Tol biopolymer transport system component